MNKTSIKKFINTPFSIKCSVIENGPGVWNSTKIEIYRNDILIGEYIRNYSNYAELTFYPFKKDNEWYALYSAEYTTTQVMKLHEDRIEDWCGGTRNLNGFCPVEIYVPHYITSIHNYMSNEQKVDFESYYIDCDYTESEFQSELLGPDFSKDEYMNFGFMCGCVWGDDSSWKIRYVDLSKISEKQLIISEKFGYWPMPKNLTLKQCINMDCWEPNHQWISLTKEEHINLESSEYE